MPNLLKKLKLERKRAPVKADEVAIIERSDLFDKDWYITTYNDVKQSNVPPAVHYIEHGAREGRDPSPHFSSRGYLARYRDVKIEAINPLIHYIRHGQREGRITSAFPDHSLGEDEHGREALVAPQRDRNRNAANAANNTELVSKAAQALDGFINRLRSATDASTHEIPRIFHFVYGFKNSGEDLPYYGYMAIKSALYFNPGWRAFFHCLHEPVGPRWTAIQPSLEVIRLEDFDYFGQSQIYHYAHKADIVRLLALKHAGGAYLDIDTITQRSYEDLLSSHFCMGVQAAGPDSASGLCNAVMLSRPNAPFLEHWISHYDYFRSTGRDDLWDYHSVKLPGILMTKYPEDIKVLDYRSFFFPLWNTIETVLFSDEGLEFLSDLEPAYCFHLWNGASGPFLEKIDEMFVSKSKSIYARIAGQVEGITK
ncbi:glycosyltransferase [Methylobacterium gnaphalii]|uniref:glycosyltransferase n=1 Tax=Methylobacterium gnaphalii TaxID=1010610 RepID=UPI0011BED761|nr:glycosyltransferase [Methylobacterium gnaphalii]GJD69990.1 hypothetical protein MMMDOFMJ_2930 [Methylobacterium gnaphalii]